MIVTVTFISLVKSKNVIRIIGKIQYMYYFTMIILKNIRNLGKIEGQW